MSERRAARPPASVPAIVIGEGVTLLGAIRGLDSAGIPTYAATTSRDYTRWSRCFRDLQGAPSGEYRSESLVTQLAAIPVEQAVVIPCSDSISRAVANIPQELRHRFLHASCPPDLQAVLTDKLRFAAALRRFEIAHPRTIELTPGASVQEYFPAGNTGFLLKPRDSESFSRRYGVKACLVTDADHARRKLDGFERDGQGMVLQEFIPGPPTQHYFVDGFVDRHGRVRARFARRRLRIYPSGIGNSSCSVSIALSEVAEACRGLDRLLAGLGYHGIFSAEFKRDPRDGVDRLLEINARPWWYIGFAAECGFNAAAMAHRDALGLEVPELTTYRVGRRCVYRRIDLKACFRDYRQGELGLWGLATEWLRGSSPIFKWTDPGPGLAAMAGSARNLVRVRPPRTSP